MATKYKEVEESFTAFLKANDLSNTKYLIKASDARLGKYCGIYKINNESGGISNVTGMYSYGEMIAYLSGFMQARFNNPFN